MIDKKAITKKVLDKHFVEDVKKIGTCARCIEIAISEAEKYYEKENEKHEHLICPMCYASVEKSIRQATAKEIFERIEDSLKGHGSEIYRTGFWQQLKKEVLGGEK